MTYSPTGDWFLVPGLWFARPGTKNQGPGTRRTPALIVAMLLVGVTVRADPQTDYLLNCRGCHGPDGSGIPGAAPTFRGQVGMFLWVPGGREYLIRVPGTAQSGLPDAQVAALLNWIVREFSPDQMPADFVPYTAEEVGRHRRPPLTEVDSVRRQLLGAIAEHEAHGHTAAPARPSLTEPRGD